jgi:hydrogenase nickel incorporation protein HypA/HybF
VHELSLTNNILNTVLKYARKTNSRKVVTVVLRVGALRDIKGEWIQHYFNYISKGTAAEDAEILILPDPIVCRCRDCGNDFEIDRDQHAGEEILCPNCSTANYTLISGTQFLIEGIEVI